MIGCLMPDWILFHTLETAKKILVTDLEEKTRDEDTYLYKLLGLDEQGNRLQLNRYDVFKQAKKMLTAPHNMSVNFGYNQEVANIISLHILLPSETARTEIGNGEGYLLENDSNTTQNYYTQMYESTYQIMITSSNGSEVNVTYHLFKSMLLLLVEHLEFMGLRNPSFSGNDIVMQDDLVPVPIFHKVLNVSFNYEHVVPKLFADEFLHTFTAIGNMKAVIKSSSDEKIIKD